MPTLAEYKSLGNSSPTALALQVQEIPFLTSAKGHGKDVNLPLAGINGLTDYSVMRLVRTRASSYNCNPERTPSESADTKGYPFITWERLLWQLVPANFTSDGYPNSITGSSGQTWLGLPTTSSEIFEVLRLGANYDFRHSSTWSSSAIPTRYNFRRSILMSIIFPIGRLGGGPCPVPS